MIQVITIVLGALMLIASLMAIYCKKLIMSVIASGVVSLFASILYLILAAPDVAMTEAAIGSALTTLVFIYAITRIKEALKEKAND